MWGGEGNCPSGGKCPGDMSEGVNVQRGCSIDFQKAFIAGTSHWNESRFRSNATC